MSKTILFALFSFLIWSPVAHSTLAVAVITRDGLLVASDRLTFDRIHGDQDAEKMFQVSPNAAFVTTGNVSFYNIFTESSTGRQFLKLAFAAERITLDYSKNHTFSPTEDYWKGLANELQGKFIEWLRSIPYSFWPESGDPPDNCLFQIVFFHVDAIAVRSTSIRFAYIKGSSPIINIFKVVQGKEFEREARPVAFGNTAVFAEIQSGKDSRFEDVRNEKLMQTFMSTHPEVKTVTLEEGLEFVKEMIRITSERTHLLENSTAHVGARIDIALLSPTKGFHWIGQNIDIKSVPNKNSSP